MNVILGEISYTMYQFPLRRIVQDNDCKKVKTVQNIVFINQRTYKLKQKGKWVKLGGQELIILDLRLSKIRYIGFTACYNIAFLDISHSFIFYLDVRQMIDLEVLRLMNTGVRRLNLLNQQKLKFLCCNYTRICYLLLPVQSQLKCLQIEYSEQLKLNGLHINCEVSVDRKQTVSEYRCKIKTEKKMQTCVFATPQLETDCEQTTLRIPKYCNSLLNRNTTKCKKLEIKGDDEQDTSSIDFFQITNYPSLKQLSIRRVQFKCFYIARLPALTSIAITELKISSILLVDFPRLGEIKITRCLELGQLDVKNCRLVRMLNINHIRVIGVNVADLGELRKLHVRNTRIARLDLSRNTRLEALSVSCTKIRQLDTQALPVLSELYASRTSMTELDVSGNTLLQELDISDNAILHIAVQQLAGLQQLWIYGTNITRINLLSNIKLALVWASSTCRVSGCCCKVTVKN